MNGDIASSLTYVVVKFVVAMLLLSVLTCVVVYRRRNRGIAPLRVAAEVIIAAVVVGIAAVLPALIRSGLDVGRVLGNPGNSFPAWSVLASGLSFLGMFRWLQKGPVAA